MTPFRLIEGEGPVVISVPHASTYLPEAIEGRLNANGATLADTDWHVDSLAVDLAGRHSLLVAKFHRYVVDANRDPNGMTRNSGQATPELVSTTDLSGNPIWGMPPSAEDVVARRTMYHDPYHAALAGELERQRKRHGIAVLLDLHSTPSVLPRLFEGTLTPLNLGTSFGSTCAPAIEAIVTEICLAHADTMVNGRFRGGWTVRHHADPAHGIHAVQLQMAQRLYMDEAPPFALHAGADMIAEMLRQVTDKLAETAVEVAGTRNR